MAARRATTLGYTMQNSIQTDLRSTSQELIKENEQPLLISSTAKLTQEELKELIYYEPDTGYFRWLKRSSNRIANTKVAGCYDLDGYVRIRIKGILYHAHRLAWFYTFNEWPLLLDHIDRDKWNNTIENLRIVTVRENNLNKAFFDDKSEA